MKLPSILLLSSSLAALAATEEQINKHFSVQSGGKLVVDVDFGSIEVNTNSTSGVMVDVWRRVSRSSRSAEEQFLRDHPVNIAQEGDTVTIRSRRDEVRGWSWNGRNRNEAKYILRVPAQFGAQLKTSGGGISVSDLTGECRVGTSGGGLKFARLHGPLNGTTSGGSIHVVDCAGTIKINTSGGGIDVSGGSGSLDGDTSGGSVSVKRFNGPAHVKTSGGSLTVESVGGRVQGSTSGGSISAVLPSPLSDEVNLSTSGGGITVRVPRNAAFNLDASTSAGSVSSDLPVAIVGKSAHSHMRGAVNGGGKQVLLRTSAGGIHVKTL